MLPVSNLTFEVNWHAYMQSCHAVCITYTPVAMKKMYSIPSRNVIFVVY